MNILWSYFWPLFAAGLLAGAVGGLIGFRSGRRNIVWLGALALAIAAAGLWHGPMRAADRLTTQIERDVRATLVYYEMTQVSARLHRAPLSRRVILSGPADDFQRSELVRVMGALRGVSGARWTPSGGGVPLILEAMAAAVAGFLLGLLLAYLVDLRRRHNAQWNW